MKQKTGVEVGKCGERNGKTHATKTLMTHTTKHTHTDTNTLYPSERGGVASGVGVGVGVGGSKVAVRVSFPTLC